MSNIDTYLNLEQTLRVNQLSKLSNNQLKIALANNNELKKLRDQLSSDSHELNRQLRHQNEAQQESLSLQNKIIENQIKEIEYREIQKFHKQRLFKIREQINDYYKLTDKLVKDTFTLNFLGFVEELILDSKNTLEEINDKEFALKLQEEIKKIQLENGNSSVVNPVLFNLNEKFREIEREEMKIKWFSQFLEKCLELKNNIQNLNNELKINSKNELDKLEKKLNIRLYLTIGFGLWAGIAFIIDCGDVGIKNIDVLRYVILVPLFFVFLFLTIDTKGKVSEFKKNNNSDTNSDDESNRILNKFDKYRRRYTATSNRLEILKKDLNKSLDDVFSSHPEYKIIDYAIIEQTKNNHFNLENTYLLFEEAARITVINQTVSHTLLERNLNLDINHTIALIDILKTAGIIEINEENKTVLIKSEEELNSYLDNCL